MTTATKWMREPEQARSRETVERIFAAAEALLADEGVEGASLTEIVRRAGVSTGAFYARFDTKEHLFHALHQRFLMDARSSMADTLAPSALSGLSLAEIVKRIVAGTVTIYRRHPGALKAAFYLTRVNPNDEFIARTSAINEELVRSVSSLVLMKRDEIAHPNPAEAARFMVTFVTATLRETVIFDAPLPKPDTDKELIDEVSYLAARYIGAAHV